MTTDRLNDLAYQLDMTLLVGNDLDAATEAGFAAELDTVCDTLDNIRQRLHDARVDAEAMREKAIGDAIAGKSRPVAVAAVLALQL